MTRASPTRGSALWLVGVELGHIDIDEADAFARESRLGGAGEIAVARADADHEIRLARQQIGALGAGDADGAQVERIVVSQRALARLRLADRDAGALGEALQRIMRLAVVDAAAGDDQRLLAGADPLGRALDGGRISAVARDLPDALLEQEVGIIVGFGLRVLRQRQRDRARIRRRGQHAHGFRQRGDQLLGAVDAIPIARDRLEAVVDADVLRMLVFQLLQHGRLDALGEDIAGQQQHRDAIDGGDGGAGDHVGGAGPDGRGAGEGGQAVAVLGVGDRRQDLGLLVAALVIAQLGRVLLEGLAEAGDIAVAEDAPGAGEEGVFAAIAGDVLGGQVADEGLRHGEAGGGRCHAAASFQISGLRIL